jgi:hypothetical protein
VQEIFIHKVKNHQKCFFWLRQENFDRLSNFNFFLLDSSKADPKLAEKLCLCDLSFACETEDWHLVALTHLVRMVKFVQSHNHECQ